VDVWALGASLFPLLTGRRLYESPADPAFAGWLAQGRAAELLRHYQAYTPISTQAR
jgi:serine/threonine protein kinase